MITFLYLDKSSVTFYSVSPFFYSYIYYSYKPTASFGHSVFRFMNEMIFILNDIDIKWYFKLKCSPGDQTQSLSNSSDTEPIPLKIMI